MSLVKILETLQQLELSAAELYRDCAEMFAAHREASGVFFRLSLEEHTHANLLAFQKRLVLHGAGPVAVPDVDLGEVVELIAKVEAFRVRRPRPTLEEAVQFATFLEQTAAERLHARVLTHLDGPFGGLLKNLAADDARHEQLLATLRNRLRAASAAC